ncbi:hypothetical protein PAXRUDRAFT_828877 [Paxillus rubicundulus Ve08.2h10]|uniref:Uncharacterized protein n=1 Tax=Paxillus rubicundulus Ve08.2h10 TaxID=930991 RepID=A0A0D0E0S5_9AGAM|nr:hypothetical protein PAXRUDRAFT_828877 [Paxillus rubicundulus Ve08.2h10]
MTSIHRVRRVSPPCPCDRARFRSVLISSSAIGMRQVFKDCDLCIVTSAIFLGGLSLPK